MKIVVIGAGGMLGSMVACVVASRSDLDVVATLRDPASAQSAPVDAAGIQWRALDVEVATSAELTELLRGVSWVINAVGVIKPYIRDTDAASVQRALLVNSLFPQVLATVAEECGPRDSRQCSIARLNSDRRLLDGRLRGLTRSGGPCWGYNCRRSSWPTI